MVAHDSHTRHSIPLGSYSPETATPGPPRASNASEGPRAKRVALFRWRGVVPLVLFILLLAAGWMLFGDHIVETTAEEAMTKLLGADVSISGLRVRSGEGLIDVRGMAVADPFDPRRNLVETGPLRLEIERAPLLEKKLIVRRLGVRGLRFNVPRARPAKPAPPDGYAARTVRELRRWRERFVVPALALTPVDTIHAIVLDPTRLASVREALALRARADSARVAIDDGWKSLRLADPLDSARAIGDRLSHVNVRTLGLDGTRQAITDVRRTLGELQAARQRVESLDGEARASVTLLVAGVAGLEEARRRDHDFARSLLQVPIFEGPTLGNALFGRVSIDCFEQALYWAELAEHYMPPGLRPRQMPGPTRLREAGTSVQFPKPAGYPSFLLRRGDLNFELGSSEGRSAYSAILVDVTSQPALLGRPTRVATRRSAPGTRLASVWVNAILNHSGTSPRDSVTAAAEGVMLPSVTLPGLPLRADLGAGSATLIFARHGDELRARWTMTASDVQWHAAAAPRNDLETLVVQAVSGVHEVDLVAELTGTLEVPRLAVRSNLDRIIADRVRAAAGGSLAKAEAKARLEVDRLLDEKAVPLRAEVSAVRRDADRRAAEARARLEEERVRLQAKLEALSRGLLTLPAIPGG